MKTIYYSLLLILISAYVIFAIIYLLNRKKKLLSWRDIKTKRVLIYEDERYNLELNYLEGKLNNSEYQAQRDNLETNLIFDLRAIDCAYNLLPMQ